MASLTPQAFAKKWAGVSLSERSSYQQHFLDLCAMLGQLSPSEADPNGSFFTFEKGVEKTGGGKGFADVWYEGLFAIEYKGRHKNLGAAYQQLQQYREALGNPPLLVVTDTERYEVHTNFTGTVKRVYRFSNTDLPKPENLRVLRALFEVPEVLKPGRTVEGVTEEAAERFARLADGLRARGVEPHAAAHFLNRVLFCLFAEDIGLLPRDLFTRVVERTVKSPDLFVGYVGQLFEAMRDGRDFLLEDIPRFDGGLYAEGGEGVVDFTGAELRVLLEAARLDWGSVEPAIFGTLFERSLDPAQRARLGAHYTGRDDILAVVEPVLMAPLRREWEAVREKAAAEAEKSHEGTGTRAAHALRRAGSLLNDFAERLRGVRVLDPACGSGNFLYVSLKELLDLEKEVSAYSGEVGLTPFFPGVSPEQLYGIETSPYAHELAQVAVWIGYLQWMHDNGFGTRQEPILGSMTNIREMDALIERDEGGSLREPSWPEADVIVGNPPFLGGNRLRREFGDEYLNDLWRVYEGRVPAFADLVCYWFERAREQIASGSVKRVGLLATNSIRGGVNRRVLENIRRNGDIFFAESDRPWILNGAAVRVSMVGFDDGSQKDRTLDGAPVEEIYADLTGALDLTSARQLEENLSIQFEGTKKGASFEVPLKTAKLMLEAPINPNGRSNSDVVRPWANAMDITRRSRNVWIVDFGAEMTLDEAALYEMPFGYIKEHVKPKYGQTRRKWWLHERPRPEMRRALDGLLRYLCTPRHSKYRLFVWLDGVTLPDSANIAFARDDDYFFGVLHSRAHELWALRMGSFLGKGNDPRYTPTSTFATFPLPWPPGKEADGDPRVEAIAEAARRLDELRRNWLDPEGASAAELKNRTLTNLYNARPTWLANAHERLDAAVFAAYGWPGDLAEEEVLKGLLALNSERSGGG